MLSLRSSTLRLTAFVVSALTLSSSTFADDASTWTCPSNFPASPNVLLNPSFETVDPTNSKQPASWTVGYQDTVWSGDPNLNSDEIEGTANTPYTAHSGTQAILVGVAGPDVDTLTYSAPGGTSTVPGNYYLLSFWAYLGSANTGGTIQTIGVVWNGVTVGTADFSNVPDGVNYVQYCLPVNLQANGGDTLQFAIQDQPNYIVFDDVALQQYEVVVPTTPISTVTQPTTTTSITSTTTTSITTATASPTSTVTASTSTTSTILTTITLHPTSTVTLPTPTTTVTNSKCTAYFLTFASGCCPTSIMHVSTSTGVHRRTVVESTYTSTASAVTVTSNSPTVVISQTTVASTVLSTTTLTLPTVTSTASTATISASTTSTLTATSTTTTYTTPPKATQTVCVPVHVPEFICPSGSRTQQVLSQLELAFLNLYKAKAPSPFPSLVAQCDGSSTTYTY